MLLLLMAVEVSQVAEVTKQRLIKNVQVSRCVQRQSYVNIFYQRILPRQQTPKPAAQSPLAVPVAEVHSVEVRQVPISPLDAVHASLGNWTTEKRARASLEGEARLQDRPGGVWAVWHDRGKLYLSV